MVAQKGFTQILVAGVIAVLVAGVGVGIYLVKQRTNIEPKAEELVQQNRNITGDFAPAPNIQSPAPFQIPEFLANLIPTSVPTPQLTTQPSPTSSAGSTSNPIPTTVITLTATPVPTLVPTIFPSPTLNLAIVTPTAFVPTSIPISIPISTTVSLEGHYRVSFDSNFNTLIDTGDGGIFGENSEKTVPITLTGSPGQKYIYIQFYEGNAWIPETPIVASISLI